jgi:hypothetical protein
MSVVVIFSISKVAVSSHTSPSQAVEESVMQIRPMHSASYRSVVKHRLYLHDKTGITAGSSYVFPVEVHERVNDDGKSTQ